MSSNPAEKCNKKKANKTKQYEQDMNDATNYTIETAEQNGVCEPKIEVKTDDSFVVKVDIEVLNIRKGPGKDCEKLETSLVREHSLLLK